MIQPTSYNDRYEIRTELGEVIQERDLRATMSRIPHALKWVVEKVKYPTDNGGTVSIAGVLLCDHVIWSDASQPDFVK